MLKTLKLDRYTTNETNSVTLVSVVRLHTLDDISNSEDVSFDNLSHATLSAVEVNVGIICACLPAMRPLFALMMPKYFSAASQFTNIPVLDIERPKHMRNPSGSTQVNTTRANTPRVATPHQAPRPTLSRSASGRFSVANSRPHTPGIPSIGHSRSASHNSIKSQTAKPNPVRFQGRINPLRMSPVTPFSPPVPLRLSKLFPVAPGSYNRRPSDVNTSTPSTSLPPRTPGSAKPLPLTPFPVGSSE